MLVNLLDEAERERLRSGMLLSRREIEGLCDVTHSRDKSPSLARVDSAIKLLCDDKEIPLEILDADGFKALGHSLYRLIPPHKQPVPPIVSRVIHTDTNPDILFYATFLMHTYAKRATIQGKPNSKHALLSLVKDMEDIYETKDFRGKSLNIKLYKPKSVGDREKFFEVAAKFPRVFSMDKDDYLEQIIDTESIGTLILLAKAMQYPLRASQKNQTGGLQLYLPIPTQYLDPHFGTTKKERKKKYEQKTRPQY